VLGLLLLAGGPVTVAAQEQDDGGGENGGETETYTYEPYRQEEFPQWARKLRRFETILIGSIPFTFFFTNIGFDTHAYVSRGFDENYLPLLLGSSPEKEALRYDTRGARLAVSLSLSGAIALLDYVIGRARDE
jgi:hypothetical protein